MSWLTLINLIGNQSNYFKWNFIQHNIGHENLGTTHPLKVKNKISPRNSYRHFTESIPRFNLTFGVKQIGATFPIMSLVASDKLGEKLTVN